MTAPRPDPTGPEADPEPDTAPATPPDAGPATPPEAPPVNPRDRRPGQQFGGDLLTEIFDNSLDPGYVAAAESGRKATTWGVVGRVVTLMLIGVLLAVAYQKVVADAPAATQARDKLVSDVKRDQASADQLQGDVDRLRDQVAEQRDQALREAGGDAAYLRDLEAVTGLGRVRGDGVTVTVADSERGKDPVTGKTKPGSFGKIYDRDLQRLVNALWSAGAEAVAINGQRLTAVSTIRAAGGAILVDFRPVSSPYKITAIGPEDMDKRFTRTAIARQFQGYVGQYGIVFGVKRTSKLTLNAAGDPQLRYARPSPTPAPTPSPSRPASPTPTGGGR